MGCKGPAAGVKNRHPEFHAGGRNSAHLGRPLRRSEWWGYETLLQLGDWTRTCGQGLQVWRTTLPHKVSSSGSHALLRTCFILLSYFWFKHQISSGCKIGFYCIFLVTLFGSHSVISPACVICLLSWSCDPCPMKRGLYKLFPIRSSRFKYQFIYLWPQAGYSLLKWSRDGGALAPGNSTEQRLNGYLLPPSWRLFLSPQSPGIITSTSFLAKRLCFYPLRLPLFPKAQPRAGLCALQMSTQNSPCPNDLPSATSHTQTWQLAECSLYHTVLPASLQREWRSSVLWLLHVSPLNTFKCTSVWAPTKLCYDWHFNKLFLLVSRIQYVG